MPFCHLTLTAPKPAKTPQILETWGDHLLKRRLELKLFQREVAQILRVNETSVYDWEKHRTDPMVHLIPRITQFLGYTPPMFNGKTTGQKIIAYRRVREMSQRKLALSLKVDPATLGRWERDESLPTGKLKIRVEPFLRTLLEKDGAPEG